MTRICLLISVVTLVACGPGPLPEIPRTPTDEERKKDWFPSASYDPYPLDLAIGRDQLEEARQLLKDGADPNRRWGQSGDRFPLQEVIDTGGLKISDPAAVIRLLLKHGADPNAKWCPFETRGLAPPGYASCTSAKGMTALIYATMPGHRDVVAVLLQAGADPQPRDWSGRSALDFANDEVIFELISRAMFPDIPRRDQNALGWLRRTDPQNSPLFRVLWLDAEQGEDKRLARVRSLLAIGADPNERIQSDRTSLSLALTYPSKRMARVLLRGGADVNQRWCDRFPAPRWAAYSDSPTGALVPGKDPACTLENGMTPLMWTAATGDFETVELLLTFNADRSLKDWAGRSAVHYATTREVWDLLVVKQ